MKFHIIFILFCKCVFVSAQGEINPFSLLNIIEQNGTIIDKNFGVPIEHCKIDIMQDGLVMHTDSSNTKGEYHIVHEVDLAVPFELRFYANNYISKSIQFDFSKQLKRVEFPDTFLLVENMDIELFFAIPGTEKYNVQCALFKMKDGAVIFDETFVAKAQKSLNQLKSEYTGECTYINSNGDTLATISLKNGLWSGVCTLFFRNGKTHVSAAFLDDQLHGEFIEYDRSGEILNRLQYINGELQN